MTLTEQATPKLKEGTVFTAVLPSKEKLLKMFRGEEDDICIKEFVKGLNNESTSLYLMNTGERNGKTYGTSWVWRRILGGDTLLLCKQLERSGTAPFGRSLILEVLHSDVIKNIENVTDYFGFFDYPFMYNGFLINITRVSPGIII